MPPATLQKSKTFMETAYYRRGPTAAPNDWVLIPVEELAAGGHDLRSIDQQCNDWVQQTGNRLVFASAPAIDRAMEMQGKILRQTIIIVYLYEPRSTDATQRASSQ